MIWKEWTEVNMTSGWGILYEGRINKKKNIVLSPGVEVSVGLMIMGILYGIRRLGMFFMYLWQMPQNGNAIR